MPPGPRGPYRGPDPNLPVHHRHWLALIIIVLFVAALAALVAWLVTRYTSRRAMAHAGPPMPPMPAAPTGDSALATLRLRYARGEIARDDFLQAAADLGGAPATGPP